MASRRLLDYSDAVSDTGESDLARYEAQHQETDDRPDMQELLSAGNAFVGEVVVANPDHVEGEGRSRRPRPLVTLRVMAGAELPPGTRVGTDNRPYQESEIVDVSGGEITLKITKGMGRGKVPAPHTVPTIGEIVGYYRRSPEVVQREPEPAPADDGGPIVKTVTVNQLVAYNMAYWRRHEGMTQEELGQQIAEYNGGEPWSKANVSAAERTWDGTRVRRFDADDIYMLARLFHVPILAMLMPPEDAGEQVYVVGNPAPSSGALGHTSIEEYLLSWSDDRNKNRGDSKSAFAERAWRLYGNLYDATPESTAKEVSETLSDATKAVVESREYIKELLKERELLVNVVLNTQKMVSMLLEKEDIEKMENEI